MSDTKIIQSEACILSKADPHVFTYSDRVPSGIPGVAYASRETEANAVDWDQQKLREPILTRVCEHLVSGTQYILTNCPRCLGQGTYHDIVLDASGQIVQIFDEHKLAQELEKAILTQFGDNHFHTEYGLPQTVDVKTSQLVTFIRDQIMTNVYNIQQYQWLATKQNPANNLIMELINSIDSIDVVEDPLEPSRVSYKIYIRTESARVILLQGQITIS